MKYNMLPVLLTTTFLSTPAVAQTIPEINADYLNSLTGDKVTWEKVTASREDTVRIGEKYYKYAYNKPSNYTETSTRINDTLANSDITDVVLNSISSISYGGAIYNTQNNSSVNINADFIGNYVRGSYDYGGAIYNNSSIGNITGDFIGNYTHGIYSYGGAICNNGIIGDITGDFVGNYASGFSPEFMQGGAIYNYADTADTAIIGDIIGDFIGNYVEPESSYMYAQGGAIYNYAYAASLYSRTSIATIGNIIGNFIGNYAKSTTAFLASGGAIYNTAETMSNSNTVTNIATATIGNITGDFIGNYAEAGGAIYNVVASSSRNHIPTAIIGDITGDFIGNYANSKDSKALGGAIYNYASSGTAIIGDIIGDFIGNYAKSTSSSYLALGGAIYTNQNMTFTSGSDTHFFDGNYTSDSRGKIYNAIYVKGASATMTFDTSGGGAWVINDNIEGGNYDFIGDDSINTELGTTTQYINMNNAIINAGEVTVENTTLRFGNYQHEDKTAKNWDGKGKFIASLNSDGTENLEADSVTSLTLNNAVFDISNGYLETVKLKKYSATDSFVHLDVDVDNMKSDVINVKGDVDGVTKLVIHATSDKDIRGKGQILFAESFGDTKGGETSFEVARVYKSPYLYDVIYEGVENTSTPTASKDNTWFFEMNGNDNPNEEDAPVYPNPDVPSVDDYIPDDNINAVSAPEVIAGIGLHTAGIEQTRTVVRNVSGKVANARSYCPNCGIISDAWDGKQLNNGWVLAQGEYSNIDKAVDMEAKIWGVEGGFDLQSDMNNTFGVFASYRNGEYDLSGKGARYRSNIGSEIEIDSYLAGLYYRYDKNMNWLFATVYGGTQDAEANTEDGIASFETDGLEFGASAEIGHSFALSNTTTLSPSLGIYYTQINYDDADDNVGKEYKWEDIKHLEAELGLSLSKNFENGKAYVKPSVIQTLTADDEVSITGLNEIDTYHDQTLGRIEIGGNYGFNNNWSAYGWANYTFGSDYEATSLGAGLNYAW